ncbi:hypothetical protein AB0J65_00940, partial [Streptomyces toxytricini]
MILLRPALVFTPAPGRVGGCCSRPAAALWSSGAFPDLVAAGEAQLPHGLVLDGELLVWDSDPAPCRRGVAAPRCRPRPQR